MLQFKHLSPVWGFPGKILPIRPSAGPVIIHLHRGLSHTTLLTHIIATHMRTGFTGGVVSQNTAAGGKKVRERLYGYNTTSLGIQRQTRDCGVLT